MPEPFDFSQLSPAADKRAGTWTPVVLSIAGRRIHTGAEFLIAYSRNNPDLIARSVSLIGKLQRAANGQPVNQVLVSQAGKKALVGPVLKSWRGYRDGGAEIAFSQAAAEAQIIKYQEVYEFTQSFAENPDNFGIAPDADEGDADTDPQPDGDPESEVGAEANANLKSVG